MELILIIPEWAPNIHPMIVHFPIAIFLLAVIMDVASHFLPDSWWDETKNLILYGFAAASGLAAFLTGRAAADSVFLEAEAQVVLSEHADWAELTVWFLGLYFLLRTALYFWKKADIKVLQIALTLLSFGGVFLIYETAEYGSQMVFGHAVGVQQQTEVMESEPSEINTETESQFIETEQGWRWEIGENPEAEFRAGFHWIYGSSEENGLQPENISDQNTGLSFNGDNLSGFFTSHDNYQNIQADYYVDLSSFEGEVIFANHVQDQQNYDFVSIHSDGTVKQGRISNGETEIFESSQSTITESIFVRVVVDETHFRGYIDQTMVVHGHDDAPASGGVGLAFEGSGKLIIDKIELTNL